MRKLLLSSCILLLAIISFSQSATLKGSVRDTSENKNLQNSVITLLRKYDSVLVNFTRSDKEGLFTVKNIPAGNYIIMVTRPLYAGYVDELEMKAGEVRDMGMLILTPAGKLLEEVILRQNRAIMIKGDTIEYKADSFRVSAGSNVQDLLRKMPGLEVDRKGQITAHGKKVEKVLVDGEEFFSDDPAIVTQNLRADAIDKVQSFDKKSDQAEFTGIDDGQRSKTLNLVLKDDKKKGYFGKVSAAAGTRERSSNEVMLNLFKGKKKASVFGIASNTGKIGLDWNDREKFGGGMDFGENVEVGAGFINVTGGNDWEFNDWGENYWGEGIPRNIKTGAHFSNKWAKDRYHLNGNYSLNLQKNNAEGGSLTKYILPDSAYYFHENHRNISSQQKHLFTGFYDFKLDSFSSIRIRINGLSGFDRREQYVISGSDDENQKKVNRNRRDNSSDLENRSAMGSFLYKQRYKKAGRTLSWSGSYKFGEKNSTGFLYSLIDYFDETGLIVDRDSTDQLKELYNRTSTVQSKVVYTEPLSKLTTLELNYNFNRSNNLSDRKSFDKAGTGKYEIYNPEFSSRYTLGFLSNSGGFKIQYNTKKIVANFGSNLGFSSFTHKDSAGSRVNTFNYTNLFPAARFTYKFSQQKSLNFNYNGTPQPPSIEQIQPLRENLDELNITIGNPELKQTFNHNISVSFNDFKTLTGRSIWLNGFYAIRSNAIVTSQVIDSGKRVSKFINTNGNNNFSMNGSYHFKWKKPNINMHIGAGGSGGRTVSFINNLENVSDNIRMYVSSGLYKDKEDKFNVNYNNDFSWNINNSSINSKKNTFWTQNHNFSFEIFYKKKWELGSDVNIELREKVDAFDKKNNAYNWNAFIERKIFKKNNGEIRLQVFDILDQRIGYERINRSNYIQERNFEVLRRYFLLSFTWNFSKNPGEN